MEAIQFTKCVAVDDRHVAQLFDISDNVMINNITVSVGSQARPNSVLQLFTDNEVLKFALYLSPNSTVNIPANIIAQHTGLEARCSGTLLFLTITATITL